MGRILVRAKLLDELAIFLGQLEDGGSRGPEGVDLLARKDIVVLPMLCRQEEGAEASSLGLLA